MKKHIIILNVLAILFCFQYSYAQWESMGGPNGGFANSFAVNSSGVFFALGESGLFKSSDQGKHWTSVNNNNLPWGELTKVTCFSNKVYVGTQFSSSHPSIFVSDDNGNSWQSATAGIFGAMDINELMVDSNMAIARTSYYAYLSTDNLGSWNELIVNDSTKIFYSLAIFQDSNIIVSTVSHGCFLTYDKGKTWQKIKYTMDSDTLLPSVYNENGILFIYTPIIPGNLYRSDDHAKTWKKVLSGNPQAYAVMGKLKNNRLFFSTSMKKNFYSDDLGLTWLEQKDTLLNSKVIYSYANMNDVILAGSKDKHILRSDDLGTHWTFSESDFYGNKIKNLFVDGGKMFTQTNNGFYLSNIGEKNKYDYKAFIFKNDYTVNSPFIKIANNYINVISGGIYTIDRSFTTLKNLRPSNKDIYTSIIWRNNQLIAASETQNGGKIYLSVDSGKNWTDCSFTLSTNDDISKMQSNSSGLFGITYSNKIYYSTDTWSSAVSISDNLDKNFYINDFVVVDSTIVVCQNFGNSAAYYSNNLGGTWNLISNDALPSVRNLFTYKGFIFAGTDSNGVYCSRDRGKVWESLGLSDLKILSMSFANDSIYVATATNGIYKKSIGYLLGIKEDAKNSSLKLQAVNNVLTVFVPKGIHSSFTVSIYDIIGNKLYHSQNFINNSEYNINISDLSMGTYLVSLSSSQNFYTAKFIKY